MTFLNALWFCGGLLGGAGAMALMAGASVGMQRDREGRLLASLKECRRALAVDTRTMRYEQILSREEYEATLARADLAIAYSMEAQS